MDPQATTHLLNTRLPQTDVVRPWMLPIAVALAVIAGLVGAKEFAGVPKPLLVTLAACFLACLIVFGMLHRGKPFSLADCTTRLLVPWLLVSASLLGAVYQMDRSGWVWFRLSGYNQTMAEQRPEDVHLSLARFVLLNPEFSIDPEDETQLVLRQGEYTFTRTVVVPKDTVLTIDPGTIVRMPVGRSLITYSPIIARGTRQEPIVFTARHAWFKWGVIGVVGAEPSVFEHVHLEHARQAVVNGMEFPGGLSLIESDAEIRHCQFTNMCGKDAVYVRRGHVVMEGSRVLWAFKDGVDLDDASGQIRHNLFVDCDDEGIDLSGNVAVDVTQNTVRDRYGGRIDADYDLARIKLANFLESSSRD